MRTFKRLLPLLALVLLASVLTARPVRIVQNSNNLAVDMDLLLITR